MHPFVNIASNAARQAGTVITRALDHGDKLKITEKTTNDYVTHIDQQCEAMIIDEIHKAYPDHLILAEESGASRPEASKADVEWIIDPLDGTNNFIHGNPQVSVSIAVRVAGRVEHGVIYDPFRQELFSASRGRGAQCNQQRLRITRKGGLENALIATGFPFRNKQLLGRYLKQFQAIFPLVSDLRRMGSAALDLAHTAAGRLDGYWEENLAIWDLAAGALLVREAGGMVCDTDGSDDYLRSGNIMAGNSRLLKEMLTLFKSSVTEQAS